MRRCLKYLSPRGRLKRKASRPIKYLIVFALLHFLSYMPAAQAGSLQEEAIPKNIILFIGDGMGVGHITAAKVVKGKLNLEQFKTVGLLTTHPKNTFITSSMSSTTALVTGFQTNYGYINISPSGEPLKTALEYAEDEGKSTGLVVTSSLTDATPACLASHQRSRHAERAIAEEIVDSGVDVMFGGGLDFFMFHQGFSWPGRKKRDLIAELKERHQVVTTVEEFRKLQTPKGAYGFFATKHLPPVEEREISLTEMAQKAIDILSTNEKGFFLMVEGSQIDWAAHHGDSEWIAREMVDFDDAVGAGLKFAKEDGNTLIIVASDHETGGYCIKDGSVQEKRIRIAICATDKHTANMVPLFAYGPGSEVFGGIHQNTFVGKTLVEYVRSSGAKGR